MLKMEGCLKRAGLRIRIRSDPECFARIRNYHSGSGSDPGEEEGRKINIFTLKEGGGELTGNCQLKF